MNKKELTQAISNRSKISKDQVAKVINEITASITKALVNSEEVKINDFGTFQIAEKKERAAIRRQKKKSPSRLQKLLNSRQ